MINLVSVNVEVEMAHAEDPVTSEPRPGSAVVDCPFRYVKLGRIDD